MAKPFAGVRILDFTRFFSGPFGTYQFALQGADVIKIEAPTGDETRGNPISREWAERKMSPSFLSMNANKRSIALDLAKPEGCEVVKRLAKDADIVWENFRPGVMSRLGLGYETLAAINPRLIYCAVSGFGQTGPEAATQAFDGKIQAMSGLMSITGHPETGPTRAGFAAADQVSGVMAAFAVATALYQRTHTGIGQFVDVSMLDTMLNVMTQQVTEHTVIDFKHHLLGNLSVSRKVTANLFKCGNGHIVLAVLTEKQFQNLLTVLGRLDVRDDPRFKDWFTRTANEPALRALIEEAMREGTPEEWEKKLTAGDVPCGLILGFEQVAKHPQVVHRGLIQEVESPYGPLRLVGPAFQLAHDGGGLERAPPKLGQDTDAVLAEAGYSAAEIAALREKGVA